MKTLIRALVGLVLALWLGAAAFFPVVAGVSFAVLPDSHTAGAVVGTVLRDLQAEGLVCGALLAVLLLVAQRTRAFGRSVLAPLVLILVMLGLTGYSQWVLVPRMEADRMALGGVVDAAPQGDPHRVDFNRLHVRSVTLLEGILIGGIFSIVLLARPSLRGGAELPAE
jgi:hypothetical protein